MQLDGDKWCAHYNGRFQVGVLGVPPQHHDPPDVGLLEEPVATGEYRSRWLGPGPVGWPTLKGLMGEQGARVKARLSILPHHQVRFD